MHSFLCVLFFKAVLCFVRLVLFYFYRRGKKIQEKKKEKNKKKKKKDCSMKAFYHSFKKVKI